MKPSLSTWLFIIAAIVMSPHLGHDNAKTIAACLIGLAWTGLALKFAWWFFITRHEGKRA